MIPPSSPIPDHRTHALSYIHAKTESDAQEQHIAIQTLCEKQSWIPEWYHNFDEYPVWQTLQKRMKQPDVGVLVIYDLNSIAPSLTSRLRLFTLLVHHDIQLAWVKPEFVVYTPTVLQSILAGWTVVQTRYDAELRQRIKRSMIKRQQSNR